MIQGSIKFYLYRTENKSLQILLSRSQTGPGRNVKQEQEEISCNHVQAFFPSSCRPCLSLSKFVLDRWLGNKDLLTLSLSSPSSASPCSGRFPCRGIPSRSDLSRHLAGAAAISAPSIGPLVKRFRETAGIVPWM